MQIQQAAFVTKVVSTKKKPSKIVETPKVESKKLVENDQKKIQFKPVDGASPVASGPPQSKVILVFTI